jgi:threonyl-tRNA synthetase
LKLLAWHCDSLRYRDERESTRPAGIHVVTPKRSSAQYRDVVLVFVTVEPFDTPSHASRAAEAAAELVKQNGAGNGCVIMPFAHLSRQLAPPDVARALLCEVEAGVRQHGYTATLTSFGFHKLLELSIKALGHPGSVAYREI